MAPPKNTRSNSSSDVTGLTVDQKLDLLISNVERIKQDSSDIRKDMLDMKEDISQFKLDISETIDNCFREVKDCKEIVNNNTEEIARLEDRVGSLTAENISLKRQVCDLQKAELLAEQYSRRNCLEIRGVPEAKNENIINVVKNVANLLGFVLNEDMIDAVHRLSKTQNNPHRNIIVKFCRRIEMEELLKKAKVKNGFSSSNLGFDSESKVYVGVSLARGTRELWYLTRVAQREKQYRFAWISTAGKIFVRKQEGSRAVLITGKADLGQLK